MVSNEIYELIMPILQTLGPDEEFLLHWPNLLGNKPVKGLPPVTRQVLHVDTAFGRISFVIILPLVPHTTLLVAPGSHTWVKAYGEHYYEGTPESARAMEDLDKVLPEHKCVRLCLQPGELIILHGNTVHAGDAGRQGDWAPRLHWYVQPDKVENETYLLNMLGKRFADKFTVPGM
ncbi:hypothetical protein GPECTOR_1718g828 [Gonium pectorale]|uniref:Phytanoyl-CoA dioxygenase n=1 Tax=Gonium pectorale TaxID=33097 RepID=A0A150FTC9_GONPE|nr:hypothetical protein GPECTOR_1718g828 [Gonium pectorale]|eukprot:KXZ40864.1 hypothetical protein GPECTOR_1718g828 [Gonium pectorale]